MNIKENPTEFAALFPKPLPSLPRGWEVCTQQQSVEAGNGQATRAWRPLKSTFHRHDRSTRGRCVESFQPVYIRKESK